MESVSRISAMLETTRDLTLDAVQSAASSKFSKGPPRDMPVQQIKKLLDSKFDREVIEGLRKVIFMMYRSKPCLPFFSSIIKNVASPNIEIKKLVYIYLLRYAEAEPDLALLSINTIQKTLSDQNPQVRAMALRVMSGIKVPVISQIVSLAIKKGCGDMSPLVRKAAALAIPKCYRLEPGTLPQLLDYLSILLGDKQYYVVGPAIVAFLEVCPDRIDLIHKHYRALVRKLVDMDDWGQLALMRLMTYYARKCFPRRTTRAKTAKANGFYEDEDSEEQGALEEMQGLDPDLELFLEACRPLLHSRSSAVIVAVTRCYLYLGTPDYIDSAIGPLVALLRNAQDVRQIILYNIVSVCLVRPASFISYVTHFFVRSSDTADVWRLKLEILTLVFPHCTATIRGVILSELEHFTKASQSELVRESARAIGRCAQNDSSTSPRCLNILLRQISSPDEYLVAEALTVIRHMIQQDPPSHTRTVIRLAKNLDIVVHPEARATIIWLVGEFVTIGEQNDIAPDVLRILVQGFAEESEAARLQIIVLAAKIYVNHLNKQNLGRDALDYASQVKGDTEDAEGENGSQYDLREATSVNPQSEHPIAILWQYVLLLARYDTSYDLRDRTRLYKALLSNPSSTQLANLLLLAPKPVPHNPSPSEGRGGLLLGTASLFVGEEAGPNGLPGYEPLPDWVVSGQEPDPKLRDEADRKMDPGGINNPPAGRMLDRVMHEKEAELPTTKIGSLRDKSLDDWLAEEENGVEGETEEEDEATGDEEGEEEESEEETDDETDSEDSGL